MSAKEYAKEWGLWFLEGIRHVALGCIGYAFICLIVTIVMIILGFGWAPR